MAQTRDYVITSTRKNDPIDGTIVEAVETGGLALQSLKFNVKRNQSVKVCRKANGKVRRIVKAKPVKG